MHAGQHQPHVLSHTHVRFMICHMCETREKCASVSRCVHATRCSVSTVDASERIDTDPGHLSSPLFTQESEQVLTHIILVLWLISTKEDPWKAMSSHSSSSILPVRGVESLSAVERSLSKGKRNRVCVTLCACDEVFCLHPTVACTTFAGVCTRNVW